MDATTTDNGVLVRMTSAEALVLFEWIHRHEESDTRLDHLGFVDAAERQVLWDVSASLERVLVEPFRSDYDTVLAEARAEVRPVEE